jgi:hypothetical protein
VEQAAADATKISRFTPLDIIVSLAGIVPFNSAKNMNAESSKYRLVA